MRWSSFTRTSSSVGAASMPLSLDGEGGRDDRIDVLFSARRVVDPVVADLGRVARGDLVDAELGAAHRAELAAEAVDEDFGALASVLGRRREEIGRASCRERVEISVVAVS